jgi:NAD(P)-dependent dehydrogenase (short-subunit alcohol dehydrogenase family)
VPGALDGKVCLVTGAGGGIGRAVTLELARAGGRLAVVDHDEAALERVTGELAAERGSDGVVAERADVADAAAVERYVAETVARLGGLDVLCNAAGVEGALAESHEYEEAEFDRVMAVNVKGTWLNLRYAIRAMSESGGGSIVNIASGAALRALPGLSAYVASKHAVLGLTRTAAVELATSGIRVNALCPGPVETRMMDSLERELPGFTPAQARELYLERVPMKRYATPQEVAAAALFLASDAASFVTGAVLSVDGGASAA